MALECETTERNWCGGAARSERWHREARPGTHTHPALARRHVILAMPEVADVRRHFYYRDRRCVIGPARPAFTRQARRDGPRIVRGMVYVIRHALMWKEMPRGCGPDKTRYHASIRWSR